MPRDNWLQRSFDPEVFEAYQRQEDELKRRRDRDLAAVFGYEQQQPEPQFSNSRLIDGSVLARNSDCESKYRASERFRVQRDIHRIQLKGVPDTDRLVEVRLAGKLLNPKLWSYNTQDNELIIELTSVFPGSMANATLEVDFCDTIPF